MIPLTAIAYAAVFVSGVYMALWLDGAYGVYLYIINYFSDPLNRYWGASLPQIRYAFVIGLVTMLAYSFKYKRYSENKIFSAPQSKWLLMMYALVLLTFVNAYSYEYHEEYSIILIKYLVLYCLIVKLIDSIDKFEKLIWVFLAGQFYIAWLAREFGRGAAGRLEGLAGPDCKDANGSAALLITAIPLVMRYLLFGTRLQRICSLPILVFIINALVLINSRGAIVGLAVALVYFFYKHLRAHTFPQKTKGYLVAAIALFCVLSAYLADTMFVERMATIEKSDDEGGYTGRERIYFWMKTFDMVRDYPFGAGAMGYDFLSSEYLPPEALTSGGTRAVHSLYFQVLAEYGYLGFVLFACFLASNFRYMSKLRKELSQRGLHEHYSMVIAMESGFVAFLSASVFISTFYMEVMYWYAGFMAAFGNIVLNKICHAADKR